jgi:Ca-activated chloride channel family protein
MCSYNHLFMINALFKDPYWLLGWGVLPFLVYILFSYLRWRARQVALLGPSAHRLLSGFSKKQFFLRGAIWLISFGLLVVVMANPHWGTRRVKQSQKAADVLLAFDISKSMLATDLRPNRLVRARLFAQDLINRLSGNRIGLLFFAGDAFLAMPPSTDYTTISTLISEADPESYSAQGTSIEAVVELATNTFDTGTNTARALVIITDGEEHEGDPVASISSAFEEQGIHTYLIGAGTPEGGLIPLPGGGVQRDAKGEIVYSKMNIDLLGEMAQAGGSETPQFIIEPSKAVSFLVEKITALPSKEIAVRQYDSANSLYQWFLLPALLLLFLELFWANKEGDSSTAH